MCHVTGTFFSGAFVNNVKCIFIIFRGHIVDCLEFV